MTEVREQALAFGPTRSTIGILSDPPAELRGGRPAFVMLNSGVLHRVGPNRLHVPLARQLAARGFPVLRFDLAGVGESQRNNAPGTIAERFVAETRQAMDFLAAARNVQEFVLLGNCSGAGVSFYTAQQDPRVRAAVLINLPGARRVPGYLLRLARNKRSWKRLIKGSAQVESVREAPEDDEAAQNLPQPAEVEAALTRLRDDGRDLLFVYCEWDPGRDYMRAEHGRHVRELTAAGRFHVIPGLNHDFDLLAGRRDLERRVLDWSQGLAGQTAERA